MNVDGVFFKKKISLIYNILGIAAGVVLILLFSFLLIVDSERTADTTVGITFLIILGVGSIAMCVLSMVFNRNAYFHIREDHISARFNWNTRIVCYFDEIDFVEWKLYSLSLKLKGGKRYTVFNLANAEILCDVIRKKIQPYQDTAMDKETLLSQIRLLTIQRKKEISCLAGLGVLMVIDIILCVFLTGGKDLSDFIPKDWMLFFIFAALEVGMVILLFIIANKCGKKLPVLNELKTDVQRLILEMTPTLPGNLLNVYIDSSYQVRATVFGYPNSEEVYFYIETIDKEYNLTCVYQSPVYSNIEELKPMLEEFIQFE